MTKSVKALIALAALLGIPALIAALATWRGLILSIMWTWFLVPLGVPTITIPLAIGFSLLVGFLTPSAAKEKNDSFGEAMAEGIVSPLVFLLLGWIVKLFI